MDECLEYFKQAVIAPGSVSAWSEWWSQHDVLVRQSFPRADYLRLKHRRLAGARQLLQRSGLLPPDFEPPRPLLTGFCNACGERVSVTVSPGGGEVFCSICGLLSLFQCRPRIDPPFAVQE